MFIIYWIDWTKDGTFLIIVIKYTKHINLCTYQTKKTNTGTFSRTQHYTTQGSEVHIQEDGAYTVNDQGKGLKLTILQPDGTIKNELQLELNIITKTDLKIIGVYDNIQHTFVYQKTK